ncbi:hypothetical protein [Streptosporangium fragile]
MTAWNRASSGRYSAPTKRCPRCPTDQPLTRWYRNRSTVDRRLVPLPGL